MDFEFGNSDDKSARSVFVGNIPYEVTEEKLKDIFSTVGPVLSFKLVFDRENGKPRGYGFCEFSDPHLARTAINNLNGFEIAGRTLRVDSACTEKSRIEMQNLMDPSEASTSQNSHGPSIDPEKAPEAISKAVASLPPEQMFELMKQMKYCIQQNPDDAKDMLLKNPQLSYALLQALVVMRIIEPTLALQMLHKPLQKPPNFAKSPPQVLSHPVQPPPGPPRPFPVPFRGPSVPPSRPYGERPLDHGRQDHYREMDHFDSYSRGPRDEAPQRFPGRDPRSRDPRAERGSTPRDMMEDPSMAGPPGQGGPPFPSPAGLATADPARRQLLMQVLQLPDEQIAMLPAEQRASILELKKQIHNPY